MTLTNCLLFQTDSYKFGGHWNMLRPNTTKTYSYLESRGGRFPKTLFIGLQPILSRLAGSVVTVADVMMASEFSKYHLGSESFFNYEGWMYIAQELGGVLPIEIKAVEEGNLVAVSNVLLTVESTDDKCAWLPGYVESIILKVWYPMTVATNGFYLKMILDKYYQLTSDETDLSFKMHDFSYRSVTTEEQAQVGGFAHLVNFSGTDNIQGIIYSHLNYDSGVCGFSVPASEHSISTAYGRGQGEVDYVLSLLEKYKTGHISVVGDTYDIFQFTEMLYTNKKVKKEILSREGVFVERPDSGYPPEVLSKMLTSLWKGFGGHYNSKGYKVINPKVRIIQGDGIDAAMVEEILKMMMSSGFAADNLVFGSGSALLNKNFDRDTQQFAFKAAYIVVDGEVVNLQKDPITSKSKKSKTGNLKLYPVYDGTYRTISSTDSTEAIFNGYIDALRVVFRNGVLYNTVNMETVRANANRHFQFEKDQLKLVA